ncbi:MAG TPA: helix-turn-helix transcriptional regulator [Isosphaeraceae bacterium]|nr:helix-turn-helix transcriptional regulator [Isosphaeraceae bacterium]
MKGRDGDFFELYRVVSEKAGALRLLTSELDEREGRGRLTIRKLKEFSAVSHDTIQRFEGGASVISPAMLRAILRALGVDRLGPSVSKRLGKGELRDIAENLDRRRAELEARLEEANRRGHARPAELPGSWLSGRPKWAIADWRDPALIDEYLDRVRDAHEVLTCTQGLDSYLLPSEMVFHFGTRAVRQGRILKHADYEGWKRWADAYVERQRWVRGRSDHHHVIVSPNHLFVEAGGVAEGGRDWVAGARDLMRAYRDVTAVRLVHGAEWRGFARRVGGQLGVWDKVTVVDREIALLRRNREEFLFTDDRDHVLSLLAVVESSMSLALRTAPAFHGREWARLQNDTQESLEEILRGH